MDASRKRQRSNSSDGSDEIDKSKPPRQPSRLPLAQKVPRKTKEDKESSKEENAALPKKTPRKTKSSVKSSGSSTKKRGGHTFATPQHENSAVQWVQDNPVIYDSAYWQHSDAKHISNLWATISSV